MSKERISKFYDIQYLKSLLYSGLSNLYKDIGPEGQAEVEAEVEIESAIARDCIFKKGDKADKVYFLLIGSLQVYAEEDNNELRQITFISPGEFFGEVGLYRKDATRNASIYALRDSYFASISTDKIMSLAAKYPGIHYYLVRSLTEKVKNLSEGKKTPPSDRITAIIPFKRGGLTFDFLRKIEEFSRPIEDTIIFNSSTINSYPSIRDANPENFSMRMEALLLEMESNGKKIFLITDQEFKTWTKSCLRNCDKVILLHELNESNKVDNFEKEVMNYFRESHIRPKIELVLLNTDENKIQHTAKWKKSRGNIEHYHFNVKKQSDIFRAYRLFANQQIGIALSGGGFPGIVHAGAYKAFYEHGFIPDYIGGTSMGSFIGAGIAKAWNPDQIEKALQYAADKNPLKDFTFPSLSLLSGKKMSDVLQHLFNINIEDLPYPFFCISADLIKGQEIKINHGKTWKALLASSAIPGVFPPVCIGDYICVDGAVLNNLPADIIRQKGIKSIVGLDLESQLQKEIIFPKKHNNWRSFFEHKKLRKNQKKLDIFTVLIRSGLLGAERKIDDIKPLCNHFIQLKASPRHFMDSSHPEKLIEEGYNMAIKYLESHPELKLSFMIS
ncbi:MAG: patatin-like phospholipase family protein [Bacteroidales bacterium]